MNEEFRYIGKSIPRFDGPVKAAGEVKFFDDLELPDCWRGGVVRSELPRGILRAVRTKPGFEETGAVLVTAADVPGENYVAMVRKDYPALAEREINYTTQALALVAAPDSEKLARAMALVEAEVEPLPAVFTIEDSVAKKEIIWGEDNRIDHYFTERGDLKAGFAAADVIVEGEWSTGHQEQMYLETQGMAAWRSGDGVIVTGTMQCPFYVNNAVSVALGIPAEKVTVRHSVTGGAFGGKEDYPSILGVYAALLAWKSGHAVKMLLDRSEDLLCTPKRHPSKSRYRMGLTKDGKITALDADIKLDAGAYTTLTRVVLQRTHLHAAGAYYIPNVRVESSAWATNTPPNGAFRGFGAPQAIFAIERTMDLAADKLEIDPLDLRLANVIKTGDSFPYGQVLHEANNAGAVLRRAAEMSNYRRRRNGLSTQKEGRFRQGIGISLGLHGGGFTGSGEADMGTTAKVTFDGERFRVYTSSTEMGQGASTVLPMVAAEELGAELSQVVYVDPDTSKTPNTGPTVASRTTMYAGKAVQDACVNLKKILSPEGALKGAELFAAASKYLAEHGRLEALGYNIFTDGQHWDPNKFEGDAYHGYAWIANAVEISLDMDTYEATPTHAWIAAEIGRAVNPMQAKAQLTGGVLQAFGWAHLEDVKIGEGGRFTAAHMNAYLVPTTLDTPDWQIELLEDPCPAGCYGAKGLGELPCDAGGAAFVSAIDHAAQIFSRSVPMTGEKIFEMIEAKEGDL